MSSVNLRWVLTIPNLSILPCLDPFKKLVVVVGIGGGGGGSGRCLNVNLLICLGPALGLAFCLEAKSIKNAKTLKNIPLTDDCIYSCYVHVII